MQSKQLTTAQAYVLGRLEEVRPKPYKLAVVNPSSRYELDDKECTQQITGLVVKKRVVERPGGRLERVGASAYRG